MFYVIKMCKIINNTAPGIPNTPTTNEVSTFNPIWNWNALPIKLIIKIISPPKIEFIMSLKIAFIGIENIFPIIHNPIIQPKIINTV